LADQPSSQACAPLLPWVLTLSINLHSRLHHQLLLALPSAGGRLLLASCCWRCLDLSDGGLKLWQDLEQITY
jgi:hypothetical protein